MAKSTVRFKCGCGYQTDSPLDAMVHSDEKYHILWAEGQVKPDKYQDVSFTRHIDSLIEPPDDYPGRRVS